MLLPMWQMVLPLDNNIDLADVIARVADGITTYRWIYG